MLTALEIYPDNGEYVLRTYQDDSLDTGICQSSRHDSFDNAASAVESCLIGMEDI